MRLQHMTELIAKDYPITWDNVVAQAKPGATLGRPHIADALISVGVGSDREAIFQTIVSPRGPYYIAYEAPSALDVVRAINASGGVPVIAHPFGARRGSISDDDIRLLAAAGLAGLEVWHREMNESARLRAKGLASELGLLQLGSSDFHGLGKPNQLGENWTSAEVLEQIMERGVLPVI
jgi:predicted metal-dependent phosphoesterase TrpH